MSPGSINANSGYHLLFSLTWIFSLLWYPVWVEPTTPDIRTLIYIFLFAWTLVNIILLSKFLSGLHVQSSERDTYPFRPDFYLATLGAMLLLNILLHLYPMSFPLMISDDEAAHASGGVSLITRFLWMRGLDPAVYFPYLRIAAWALVLFFSGMILSTRARSILKRSFLEDKSKYTLLLFGLLFALSIILFLLSRNMDYFLMLMRYPLLGKISYALSVSLFGINEFSVRIPQLLFAIITAILIFRICSDNLSSPGTGLISACFYAFSPMVFYYSALGELICGTVFFSVIVIFYYLKYVKTGNNRYLLLAFYLVSLGFLYKRVIVVMLGVLVISIMFLKENRVKFPLLIKLCYFSMVPILPYLILGKVYPNNPFGLNFANWINPGPALGYLVVLIKQLSYPLCILAIISILFIFVRKHVMSPPLFVFFSCFLLYYVLYTSSTLNTELYPLLYLSHQTGGFIIGTERYSMIFFPFISISTGFFLNTIARRLKWKHSFKLVFSVLSAYLILISTVWQAPPLNAQFVTYKNIKSRYFPVDEAMKWVRDNIKDEDRILILRVAPAAFYRDKYGIRRDRIVDIWYDLAKVSSPDKLKTLCRELNISHIMFSFGAAENTGILNYLHKQGEKNYTEVAEFNLGGNYIFIYKTGKDIPRL